MRKETVYLCIDEQRCVDTAQKDPSHVINKIVAYLSQLRKFSEKFKYNPASIIAMDETAVRADMTASTMVETIRKKQVSLKNTGHEKVRISVCLSAKADTQTLHDIWRSEM